MRFVFHCESRCLYQSFDTLLASSVIQSVKRLERDTFLPPRSQISLDFMAGSRLLLTALLPALGDTQYSTLEVDHNRWLENDGKSAPIVVQDPMDGKIIRYSDISQQAAAVDVYDVQSKSSRPTEERNLTEELSLHITKNRLLLFLRTFQHQHLLKHQRLLEYDTRIQAWQPCNGLI